MKARSFLLTLVLCGFSIIPSFAQDSPGVKNGSADVMDYTKSRGDDPEVKVKSRLNGDKGTTKSIQPSDKGARARGGWCEVYFDNYTDWYIDCYVDGYYEGMVAPWGEGTVTVSGGYTKVYAKAEFTDGAWKAWGPKSADCSYETFDFSLYPTYLNWGVD